MSDAISRESKSNPRRKSDRTIAILVRVESGVPLATIARDFDCTLANVSDIKRRAERQGLL